MRTITILNLCGYDLIQSQLQRMGVSVAETQHDAGVYRMFDKSNRLVADINYMRNKAKIYDYGRA